MSGGSGGTGALGYGPFAGAAAFVEVFAGRRTVGPADRGPHVKTLEQALVGLGYGLPGGATPDVTFTAGTRSALSRFQRDKGLPQSGALDRATLDALDRAAVAKRLGGGAAAPAAGGKPNTVALMRQILVEARDGGGGGGTRITLDEAKRALDALRLDDGKISADEYLAAEREIGAEGFQRAATPEAKAFAAKFLKDHAPGAKALEPALKIRKLDPAARDAALEKSRLSAEIQAAEVKIGPPIPESAASPAGLADIVRRAFGRPATEAFAVCAASDIERVLSGGVVGHPRPAPNEVKGVLAAIARAGASKLYLADWTRGKDEAGSYVAAVSAAGDAVFLLDIVRKG